MRITGVIQAGGRSARMGGRPKALMELGGRRLIDRVADVVAPRVGDRWETLHACYGKTCLEPIETRLRAGRLQLAALLDDVRVLAIGEGEVARFRSPEVAFMNVNTPAELEAARRLLPALEPVPPR